MSLRLVKFTGNIPNATFISDIHSCIGVVTIACEHLLSVISRQRTQTVPTSSLIINQVAFISNNINYIIIVSMITLTLELILFFLTILKTIKGIYCEENRNIGFVFIRQKLVFAIIILFCCTLGVPDDFQSFIHLLIFMVRGMIWQKLHFYVKEPLS